MSSLETGRLRANLMGPHSFLRRGCGERDAKLFSLVSSDRTHGNGTKLYQERCRLEGRKDFFTEKVVKTGTDFLKRWSMPQAC